MVTRCQATARNAFPAIRLFLVTVPVICWRSMSDTWWLLFGFPFSKNTHTGRERKRERVVTVSRSTHHRTPESYLRVQGDVAHSARFEPLPTLIWSRGSLKLAEKETQITNNPSPAKTTREQSKGVAPRKLISK